MKTSDFLRLFGQTLNNSYSVCLAAIALTSILLVSNAVAQANTAAQRAFQQDRDGTLQNPSADFIPGSLIIKFSDAVSRTAVDGVLASVGATRIQDFALVPGLAHIRVPAAATDSILLALQRNPLVDYVDLDFTVRAGQAVISDDAFFGLQWALLNSGQSVNGTRGRVGADIRASEAWTISTGGPSCLVAVIDSGVQLNHPDLAGNIWLNPREKSDGTDSDRNGFVDDLIGWDFVDNNNSPFDENGHGTHVAGVIAAVSNNSAGVAGVAWDCKIMALRFLNASGSGTTSGAISALEYAVSNGAKISNNSWGGGSYSSALYNAIRLAGENHGHLFIAAAGNSGFNSDSRPSYPAAYDLPNIISVAATDNRDRLASFSNYGALSVDIGAPGVDIASTYINNNYVYLSGTSMAAPHVAGVAGLITAQYPSATYEQLALILLGSARPLSSLDGKTRTGGILDAYYSLLNARALLELTSDPDVVPETDPAPDPAPEESVTEPEPKLTIPNEPSNLTAENNRNSTATLTWIDQSDNEAGFVVERQKLNRGGRWSASTETDVAADSEAYIDSAGAGTFQYRLRAYNSAGLSASTPWVKVDITRR